MEVVLKRCTFYDMFDQQKKGGAMRDPKVELSIAPGIPGIREMTLHRRHSKRGERHCI